MLLYENYRLVQCLIRAHVYSRLVRSVFNVKIKSKCVKLEI